jgi:hypothetical protein
MQSEYDSHPVYDVKRKEQLFCFLLIGCLSMLYAELFSGASQIWFFNPWSLFVTFPLYLFHVLFFLNLAFRTQKTSPVHLYLWGTLFGMYESWITQVLWIGYSADGPMIGTFLGIGIGEFPALVFFWHPILSFVLPILIFQVLVLSVPSGTPAGKRVFPSNVPFLVRTKSNMRYLWILYIIGSIFMGVNYQGNVVTVLIALGGTYALIYLLYRGCSRFKFSVYSLYIGNRGMKIVTFYMVILYTVMFVILGYYNGRIPGLLPIVTTVILYGVFIWVIKTATPVTESVNVPDSLVTNCVTLSDYRNLVAANIILASGFCFIYYVLPSLITTLFVGFYFAACILGVYLFYRAFRRRKKANPYLLSSSHKYP